MTKVIAASGHGSLFWTGCKGAFMPHVIAEPCINIKDTACVDACPVDVIHPHRDDGGHAAADQLYIFPDDCIDCGACIPLCPVSAIYAAEDLPSEWAHYEKRNADWYAVKSPQ